MSISMEAEKATTTNTTTGAETSSTSPVVGNNNKNSNMKTGQHFLDARSWLEGLSPEECAAAMSFRDGPLLASFLHLAAASTTTSSSIEPNKQQQHEQPMLSVMDALSTCLAFDVKDLNMSTDKKEWEETLARFKGVLATPTPDVATAAAAASTTTEKVTTTTVPPSPCAAVESPLGATAAAASLVDEGATGNNPADDENSPNGKEDESSNMTSAALLTFSTENTNTTTINTPATNASPKDTTKEPDDSTTPATRTKPTTTTTTLATAANTTTTGNTTSTTTTTTSTNAKANTTTPPTLTTAIPHSASKDDGQNDGHRKEEADVFRIRGRNLSDNAATLDSNNNNNLDREQFMTSGGGPVVLLFVTPSAMASNKANTSRTISGIPSSDIKATSSSFNSNTSTAPGVTTNEEVKRMVVTPEKTVAAVSSKETTGKEDDVDHVSPRKVQQSQEKIKTKEGGTKLSPEVTASAREIADNVCILFPSVVRSVSASSLDIKDDESASRAVPYVTLHPLFLKRKGTVDCVRALDSILQAAVDPSSSFLSPDFWSRECMNDNHQVDDEENFDEASKGSVEELCLRRLQSLSGIATEKKSPILLFLILLVRIEVAAFIAYRAAIKTDATGSISGECLRDVSSTGKTGKGSASNKRKKGRGKGATASPKSKADAYPGSSVSHDESSFNLGERLDSAKLTHMVGQLDVLSKVAQALNVIKLKDVVSPLMDAGFCSFEECLETSPSDLEVQNLIFTPLPVVVQSMSCLRATDGPSFESWDKAWSATLCNIQSHAGLGPCRIDTALTADVSNTQGIQTPGGDSSIDGADWMDSNEPPSSTPTPTSGAKKGKKRRKNRKKKKNGNAANETGLFPEGTEQKASRSPKEEVDASEDETVVENTSKAIDSTGISETKATESAAGESECISNTFTPAAAGTTKIADAAADQPPAETRAADAKKIEEADKPAVESKQNADENANSIAPAASFDSEKLPFSTSDETASTKSESTKQDDVEIDREADANNSKTDFTVSRVHGVGTIVVAPPLAADSTGAPSANVESEDSTKAESSEAEGVQEDSWETVEVKGRGNRKKSGRSTWHDQSSHSRGGNSSQNNKKPKTTRTPATRKRAATRKMVKDILSCVLDSVEEEVARRRQQETRGSKAPSGAIPAPIPMAWKDGNRGAILNRVGATGASKETILRDGVLGRQQPTIQKKAPQQIFKHDSANDTKNVHQSPGLSRTKDRSIAGASPLKGKGQGAGADQNTATTVPETVSAVSDSRRTQPSTDRDITRSDSSSTDTDDNRKQDRTSVPTNSGQASSPAPPLPTLLSPGNANSSSSSVASSLEAPHASHGHRHASSTNEIDVGYHLLDVCDRLTRDMHVFMARRAAALSTRRRERGALLGALQESVSSIFAGHSHVELYGSCATMLDLPSSDLDVVVCGLDHIEAAISTVSPQKSRGAFNGSPVEAVTSDQLPTDSQLPHPHHAMPQYVPVHLNAERVVRLAADLERQPWAVHVKAIPTASVPVVKVLADPSRLPGATPSTVVEGEDWMMEQHQASVPGAQPNDESPQGSVPHYQPSMAPPVWRGADVLNGLLKLDITFEGPEHGGIGSTEFSTRVVQNVCDESGLPAESTAFVQVIMVVKELLAQRRLNEPFTGGLSSYALLLLVLAVMCERKLIREELEKVERQRRVVAAGGGTTEFSGLPGESPVKPMNQYEEGSVPRACIGSNPSGPIFKPNSSPVVKGDTQGNGGSKAGQAAAQSARVTAKQVTQHEKQPLSENQRGGKGVKGASHGASRDTKGGKNPGNSWASIAMGKNSSASSKAASAGKKEDSQQKKPAQASTKPSSFADAVARNSSGSAQVKPASTASTVMPNAAVGQPKQGNSTQTTAVNASNAKKNKKQAASFAKGEATPAGELKKSVNRSVETESSTDVSNRVTSTDETNNDGGERKIEADEKTSKFNNYSSEPMEPVISANQVFPQGFNDVIEVLCSGETTPGKLLMHFLLFYGQHFDAHATAIDISGKHHRDIATMSPPYTHLSPYIQRRSAGRIDPVTGMLTVDPIVVYDPLEGAENNNVARRCFLWASVKWVFHQSYMTLSSAVERNTTPPGTPGAGAKNAANGSSRSSTKEESTNAAEMNAAWNGPYNPSDRSNIFDPSSPLLELLLSF